MKKIYTHTIRTSGYSDRYIYTDLVIIDGTAKFADPEAYAQFCDEKGIMPYVEAWDKAYDAPKTRQMTGKVSIFQTMTVNLTDDDYRTVEAYLKIDKGNRETYTAEAWQRWESQIENHPLSGYLLKIVEWQLSQCDKSNIERWGNKNGQASA